MSLSDILNEYERLKTEHSELLVKHEQTVTDHDQSEVQFSEKLSREISDKERIQTEFEQKLLELTHEKEKLEALHIENQSEIDLLASQLQDKTATLIDLETTSSSNMQEKSQEIGMLQQKIEELEKEKEVIFGKFELAERFYIKLLLNTIREHSFLCNFSFLSIVL